MNIKDNTVSSLADYVHRKLSVFMDAREVQNTSMILFQHFLGWDRADVLIHQNERVSESQLLLFYHAIEALKTNKPLQYVLEETEFFGLKIKVNSSVLIPRPETEELVEWILDSIPQGKNKVLDIGTGCGCIPLALKYNQPLLDVFACDVSENALLLASENAQQLGVEVHFFKCDILNDKIEQRFDIIVSNPPYIPTREKALMQKNVLEYEPAIALFVEDDNPLLFYREISRQAYLTLSKDGLLFFEINESFGEDVVLLMREMGFENVELKEDLQGKNRMVKGIKL